MKPFVDFYEENVQDSALKIYMNSLNRNLSLFRHDLDFLKSKTTNIEPNIREKLVDFFIDIYSGISKYEKNLIQGLITNLSDDLWNIRVKIIDFLDKLFIERPKLILKFDKELELLLDEKDISVRREGLDLLLKSYIKTYSVEDIKRLVQSIPERDWIAQEKILFLIGKLGIKRKELIKPIVQDLILALDYDDYLVNKAMRKTIEEIMEYHSALFDDDFFLFIENDKIDNLEAIEFLLRESILKHGFNRFFEIFSRFSPQNKHIIKSINNIIRKLYATNPKFVESLFSQLLNRILDDFSQENYDKLDLILKHHNHYPLYLLCYQTLKNKGPLKNLEEERRKEELIIFLHASMPKHGYQKLIEWLNYNLKKGPIEIEQLRQEFQIDKSNIMEILKNLIVNKQINILYRNNKIEKKDKLEPSNNDFEILKQIKIYQNPKEIEYIIKLNIKIKNISDTWISDLYLICDTPENIIIDEENSEKYIDILNLNQHIILNWEFHKFFNKDLNPSSKILRLLMIYQKRGKIFSIEKNLDLELL